MKIIRKSEQPITIRSNENRAVQLIFNKTVPTYDWLMVTHSHTDSDEVGEVSVDSHSHPNALELIIFQQPGVLDIAGERHYFDFGDIVVLEPQEVHGGRNLKGHDCICILLGNEEPQKRLHQNGGNTLSVTE